MSHKFRSYPAETVMSVMYQAMLDVRGTARIISLLSFMLQDDINETSMAKAMQYCAPLLQKRVSKYYTPSVQKDVDRLQRVISIYTKRGSLYKKESIEWYLNNFFERFKKRHSKTASIKNRPFRAEKNDWLAFKNSAP